MVTPHRIWVMGGMPLAIPALAVPALAILALLVRRLAPTSLSMTGAYIGLAAGGIGAVRYTFHCDDDSMPSSRRFTQFPFSK